MAFLPKKIVGLSRKPSATAASIAADAFAVAWRQAGAIAKIAMSQSSGAVAMERSANSQLEYDVFAIPPGKCKHVFFATFIAERWQWAEKLKAYLEDKHFEDVEIRRTPSGPE